MATADYQPSPTQISERFKDLESRVDKLEDKNQIETYPPEDLPHWVSQHDAILVSFGNFVLKQFGSKEVSHADIANWEHETQWDLQYLPSAHQIGDSVRFTLIELTNCVAKVKGIRFYRSKVKYDLEVTFPDGDTTRVGNIDSAYVLKLHNNNV